MAGAEWFYGKDNKQHGPVSAVQLKELAEKGALRPTDLVWREGMSDWMPASRVKGLFEPAVEAPIVTAPSEREPSAAMETELPQVVSMHRPGSPFASASRQAICSSGFWKAPAAASPNGSRKPRRLGACWRGTMGYTRRCWCWWRLQSSPA